MAALMFAQFQMFQNCIIFLMYLQRGLGKMKICSVNANRKQYLPLLLMADEEEAMIDRYLERGEMYALCDPQVCAVCVVTEKSGSCAGIQEAGLRTGYD